MTNKKLIVIFSVLFLIFTLAAFIIGMQKPDNNKVQITVNGKAYCELELDKDGKFYIEAENGHSVISIKNKEVFVVEATCPDKLCIRHGKLHNKYDAIVCLPNKIVIEYKTKSSDIDAVAGR